MQTFPMFIEIHYFGMTSLMFVIMVNPYDQDFFLNAGAYANYNYDLAN